MSVEASQLESPAEPTLRQASSDLSAAAQLADDVVRIYDEAADLVEQAIRRTLGFQLYPVQRQGGLILAKGGIAEMQTGEGKTLTATVPLYLHALAGKGAHLATANDYLATRDAEWMRPVYEALGMTVGCVVHGMTDAQRRAAYQCDITYGTCREFGFDFLRDRLRKRQIEESQTLFGDSRNRNSRGQMVQRRPHFILVDEADSLLIDDARTPLVISSSPSEAQKREVELYHWSAALAPQMADDEDYQYDREKRKVELTHQGMTRVRAAARSAALEGLSLVDFYDFMERAIKVNRDFHLDQHYVVHEGKIVIIDESTGRIAEGRRWSKGINQAIEAKEKLEIEIQTSNAAQITVQQLCNRYPVIAGMTGTAMECKREFRRVYRSPVSRVPTNRPCRRSELPARFYFSKDEKWAAVVEEIQEVSASGRPVLVGTRTIENSELLSGLLQQAEIHHVVLNARHVEREAAIVAHAGQRGTVTVATNMAGRGTDIRLGEGVAELGGLHVISAELHDSARIDRQLFGRCARQGDPGSTRLFISAEDQLLELAFGRARAERMRKVYQWRKPQWWIYTFRKAQRKIEHEHFKQRQVMMHSQKEHFKVLRESGRDPYLDIAE
jgi:preprotein translocase subunit SecA